MFASWTNDVAKPRPLWLTIKARKVTHFKAVADSPGRSREVAGTFKHGVIHWNGPNGNSSWEGKLVGNQLVGTFKATNWQGDSSGTFRLTFADGPPPATSPARVPPAGPVRTGSVRGDVWKVEGDELIREGQGDGWVGFGDPDWTDYDLTYEAVELRPSWFRWQLPAAAMVSLMGWPSAGLMANTTSTDGRRTRRPSIH